MRDAIPQRGCIRRTVLRLLRHRRMRRVRRRHRGGPPHAVPLRLHTRQAQSLRPVLVQRFVPPCARPCLGGAGPARASLVALRLPVLRRGTPPRQHRALQPLPKPQPAARQVFETSTPQTAAAPSSMQRTRSSRTLTTCHARAGSSVTRKSISRSNCGAHRCCRSTLWSSTRCTASTTRPTC